ncbi:hypothetical protein [Microbacterium sp.]
MVSRQRLDQPGAITGIARRLRSAERGANLGYSSITRGGMRVASADGLLVQTVAGGLPGLRVTGLEVVDGTLRVTGTLEGSGAWTWTGTLTQTGTTNLNGPWNLNGLGKIVGNTDISGILSLIAGGLIKVGTAMELSPAENGGSIKFDTGAVVESYGSGNGLRVRSSAGWQFYVGSNGYALNNPGVTNGASITAIGTQLLLGAAQIQIAANNLTLTSLPTVPAGTATVPLVTTAAGRIYRGS